MKLSINRNIVWSDIFINRLVQLGVKYACISPGSRSTPLTLAFASNKNIEVIPIVDERSSGFFALGLAKKTNTPVAIVTTSGTAVAELYPAIIEAYYQRVPLIICTADRPPFLRNRGANQTINQENIYENHIRLFIDAGLPDIKKLSVIKQVAEKAVLSSSIDNLGPVHINFPFEKPFEPHSFTDKIKVDAIEKVFFNTFLEITPVTESKVNFNALSKKFYSKERGIILIGFGHYQNDFAKQVIRLSEKFGYPIYVDGASSLRFGSHSKENLVDNLTAIIRAKDFQKYFDPEIIIQFGGTPTSNVLQHYFKNSKAEKILVNEFGDKNDPSLTAKTVILANPSEFCDSLLQKAANKENRDSCWLIDFQAMNNFSEEIKNEYFKNIKFPFEGRAAIELLNAIPNRSSIMISNSSPIRDIDFFASSNLKQINIFTNRGASGIDGINSTALGIAKTSKKNNYLLIGDLAFYHDLNGLHNAIKYNIAMTIVLINNNGGGIFESLPISEYKEFFTENFSTPLKIDFKKIVEAYGATYYRIKNWKDLKEKVILSSRNKKLTVLEIQTDAKESKFQRQEYWNAVSNRIVKFIHDIKS
ncbi:MAG: 2-succinyl-5-enolpyruvyl-6-hydroxy-3-cyclohexene-1-carboxylic-acid synthase [Ignavibacteriales bacterium]|nr:2-succinyl-5-enolpyruvyl-6-hydroxy-3-cyclohexene-1-carboxylic-acid synthase [Ignavibacteriales bacterium]